MESQLVAWFNTLPAWQTLALGLVIGFWTAGVVVGVVAFWRYCERVLMEILDDQGG